MKNVLYVIGAIVLILVGMKMLGLDDVISDVGAKVRTKAGMNPKDSKSEFAQEALGWDIREIGKKPVSVVKAGKARLQKVIDELEQVKLKSKVSLKSAQSKEEEAQQELKVLRESIREAKAYLADKNTQYPVNIKGFTYTSESVLRTSVGNALSRYNALKRATAYTDGVNRDAKGGQLIATINKRLNTAYEIMELLDAKLSLAEIKENQSLSDEQNKLLKKIIDRASTILAEEDEAGMASGFTSDAQRIDAELDNFND